MIRPSLVLMLLLSAVVMMRGVAGDWRRSALEPTESSAKKMAAAAETAAPIPPAKPLQPTVPANLPDLRVGYVFNQERMLAGAEPVEDAAGDDLGADSTGAEGITADIDDIVYAGSIITDAFSRALVLYSAQSEAGGGTQPTSRSSKVKAPTQQSGQQEHARMEVGEKIGGYQVAEILPDKLILTKGDETVEKLLFDPEKKRDTPPPRPGSTPPPSGGPPRPPTPGGALSTTIGGSAAPATTAATSGGSAIPAPPPAMPAQAAAPVSGQAGTRAVAPTTTSKTPTTPVRRMVISRQSSPAPDTTRVSRPTRGGDMMPPGFDPTTMGHDTPPPGGN